MLRDVFQATLRILSPWGYWVAVGTITLKQIYFGAGVEDQE